MIHRAASRRLPGVPAGFGRMVTRDRGHPRAETEGLVAPFHAGDRGHEPGAAAVSGHRRAQPSGRRQTPPHARTRGPLSGGDGRGWRAHGREPGRWLGRTAKETLAALDEAHPGRFLTFALIDFSGIDDEDWSQREADRLEESFEAGAKGLKFHKSLGLGYRYQDGRRVPVDDPKLAPVFEVCANIRSP